MATNPSHHPLAGPVVDGTNYTVDLMLKEPTRITRYLSDLMLPKYFMHRIFSSGGSVSGGAVLAEAAPILEAHTATEEQNKSEVQKALDRAAAVEKRESDLTVKLVAAQHGISEENIDLLGTGTLEQLTARA
ncbi:hypothetical protein, partial [Rhodococcus qingshengii]|uniref:hypothetical protein n=1 Tax=Rhodococcus qingshengii TaxID=334542 RepID=UPI001C1C9174|nr:hypothetical protein [Rhodococcus qingshengii]